MAEVFCQFRCEMMPAGAERCHHCGGMPADFARRSYAECLAGIGRQPEERP
jgi:hypothetical protein